MHYLVADIASTITLYPGDVLLSGTPANSRPVQPGDVVEVEVDGLGTLSNHVVAGPTPSPGRLGAQPSASEEVLSTALGGDWEFRGIQAADQAVAGWAEHGTQPVAADGGRFCRGWQSSYPRSTSMRHYA